MKISKLYLKTLLKSLKKNFRYRNEKLNKQKTIRYLVNILIRIN